MRPSFAFALVAALALAPLSLARAEDEPKPGSDAAKAKSSELMKEANAHYGDADPAKALELAEKAHALAPEDVQVMGFLAALYEIKVGDEEKALAYYDKAVRGLAGVTSPRHLRFKADLMARKANLLYAFKDDIKAAIEMYQLSWETTQLSETAFRLSNLLHLVSGQQTEEAKKADWAKKALAAAQDAFKIANTAPYSGDKAKAYAAKVRLQLAICLEAVGEKEKATKALEGMASKDCDETCAYNQALLAAIRGKGDEATEQLKRFLKTRPTPKARNRLRRFIRNDPDFQALVKRPDWKELVEDEPLDAKPADKPGAKPAEKPKGS